MIDSPMLSKVKCEGTEHIRVHQKYNIILQIAFNVPEQYICGVIENKKHN